jgi:hypothetical protein
VTSDVLTRKNQPLVSPGSSDGLFKRSAAHPPSDEVEQLRAGLVSKRRISMAMGMGILMRDRNIDEE